ncbi:MAG TPA: DUF2934 domain-containing protein, partial [Blastocatellia bacterium]|nr:DUF2934 domain-containing protein [Blastocatellia bacterium]
MSRESTDEVKARLLADSEVQLMIRMRAFEIYQMHGGHGGSAADDWFRAESEVLAFLIEEENRRAAEEAQAPSPETVAGVELAARTDEDADPETSLGVWSATEPAGLELAPAPGGQAAMEPPKKTRARSATKTAASKTPAARAKKAGDDTAKKTTSRRTASKKTADPAEKPK